MKYVQEKVRKIREHNGWKTDPKHLLLAMQEELGEVVASYLSEHDDKYRKVSKEKRHELSKELGDLLHAIIAFANEMDIDIDKSLENTNKKIKK
jgi:NTP pyrophosphatase (non-canonical NTP hydrolase)